MNQKSKSRRLASASEVGKTKKKKPRRPYRDGLPLNLFVRLLESYNRRNGTRYSYGQAMMYLETGAIKKEDFFVRRR